MASKVMLNPWVYGRSGGNPPLDPRIPALAKKGVLHLSAYPGQQFRVSVQASYGDTAYLQVKTPEGWVDFGKDKIEEVMRLTGHTGNNPRRRSAYSSDPFAHHQIKIARQTLLMPDALQGVMGGPTKEEAREILHRYRARGYGKRPQRRNPVRPEYARVQSKHIGWAITRGNGRYLHHSGVKVWLDFKRQLWEVIGGRHDGEMYPTLFAAMDAAAGPAPEWAKEVGYRSNPGWLYPESGSGSKTITFIDYRGERRKGRIVMRSSEPGSWVVNMGGRHGTPAVVHESQIISGLPGGPAMRKNSRKRRYNRARRRNSPLTVYVGRRRHTRKALIKKYGPKRASKYWRRAKTKYHGYAKSAAMCRTRRSRR